MRVRLQTTEEAVLFVLATMGEIFLSAETLRSEVDVVMRRVQPDARMFNDDLARMVRRGWVEKEQDALDRSIYRLTPSGRSAAKALMG